MNDLTPPHWGSAPTYGTLEGLPQRIADWRKRLSSPGLPWAGLGLIYDLERVMQLLTLEEFGQYLRTKGGEQAKWGDEILQAADDADRLGQLQADIERAIPVAEGQEYAAAVQEASELGERMRAVLVETGALADDDTQTDPAALLRALLS